LVDEEDRSHLHYLKEVNRQIMSVFVDKYSYRSLVNLLESIPNFRIKLTDEEKSLIECPRNVLALGRSGTGKTTCAILKLFSAEVFFRYRSFQARKKGEATLQDVRFDSDDLQTTTGLHIIFVTASPVLCNEVRRYYHRLKDNVKEELSRKRRKRKAREEAEERKKKAEEEAKDLKDFEVVADEEQQGESVDANKAEEELKLQEEELGEDDLEDDEEEELQKGSSSTHTMMDVKEEDYPVFSTVKRLIYMIDGTLNRPFFSRNDNGEIRGLEGKSEWHNEMRGVMLINSYYKRQKSEFFDRIDAGEDEDENNDSSDEDDSDYDDSDEESDEEPELKLKQKNDRKKKNKGATGPSSGPKYSFEVDYDYFEQHFYSRFTSQFYNLAPLVVWTEITSYIKGSASSHTFPGQYLSEKSYLESGDKRGLLTREEKKTIHRIFGLYERWKIREGAYDFQDVVNYVLYSVRFFGYKGSAIHFMMIDEVQDLTHATMFLLMQVTDYHIFFSGDTAQTIAKGVGFRFCDLRQLFDHDRFQNWNSESVDLEKPAVMQLTQNFRSHGRILDVANSVISLIEQFFPQTIDKLAKENSLLDGPKPVLLNTSSVEHLFNFLFGSSMEDAKTDAGLLNKPPIEFGCDQVIIVRDQAAKEAVPKVLQHALILTVYESKGLEFDDVILYNFFSDSKSVTQWYNIKNVRVTNRAEERVGYRELGQLEESRQEEEETKGEQDETPREIVQEEDDDINKGEEEQNGEAQRRAEDVPDYELETKAGRFNILKNSAWCTELKHLYVAITRPRKRLIFFDQNRDARSSVENYWKSLDVVDVCDYNESSGTFTGDSDFAGAQGIATSTSPAAWRQQGIRMMKHKFYEQAYKCFKNSGDASLERRALAYMTANRASALQSKLETDQAMEEEPKTRMERKRRNAERTEMKQDILGTFQTAGRMFEDVGLLKHAGRCYCSAQIYETAADLFLRSGLHKQAGEAFLGLKQFDLAAENFEKGGDIIQAIEAYSGCEKYENALECLSRNLSTVPLTEKQRYTTINSLVGKALNQLLESLEKPTGQQESDSNIGGMSTIEGDTIEEEDSDSSESSEDDDNGDGDDGKPEESNKSGERENEEAEERYKSSTVDQIISLENSKVESESSQSFSLVDVSASGESTEIINKESLDDSLASSGLGESFSLVGSEGSKRTNLQRAGSVSIEALEQLSNIDPNDEWLKSETGSLVDSFLDSQSEASVSGDSSKLITSRSIISDYSMLDNAHALAVQRSMVINTKTDIFVEDWAMHKIIKFVTMFNEDLEKTVKANNRSAIALATNSESQDLHDTVAELVIDLDEIDLSLVNLILDALEHFGVFKLCIIVCNRYNLTARLGRYINSIGFKFTNLCSESSQRRYFTSEIGGALGEAQSSRAFLAHGALHNVFEMINPEFLKPRETFKTGPKLGSSCFQGLILLGYWKKTLFIMNSDSGLNVSNSFGDFCGFKYLYLNYHGGLSTVEAKLKAEEPDSQSREQRLVNLLTDAGFKWLPFDKPKESHHVRAVLGALTHFIWDTKEKLGFAVQRSGRKSHKGESLAVPQFPSYLPFNASLWAFLLERSDQTKEFLKQKIVEAASFIMTVARGKKVKPIFDIKIFDAMTTLILFLEGTDKFPAIQTLGNSLPIEHCAILQEAYNHILNTVLVTRRGADHRRTFCRSVGIILRAILTCFNCQILESCSALEGFTPFVFSNMHKTSVFFHEAKADFRDHRKREEEKSLAAVAAGKEKDPLPTLAPCYLVDIEGNWIISSTRWLVDKIRGRLSGRLSRFIDKKVHAEWENKELDQTVDVNLLTQREVKVSSGILRELASLDHSTWSKAAHDIDRHGALLNESMAQANRFVQNKFFDDIFWKMRTTMEEIEDNTSSHLEAMKLLRFCKMIGVEEVFTEWLHRATKPKFDPVTGKKEKQSLELAGFYHLLDGSSYLRYHFWKEALEEFFTYFDKSKSISSLESHFPVIENCVAFGLAGFSIGKGQAVVMNKYLVSRLSVQDIPFKSQKESSLEITLAVTASTSGSANPLLETLFWIKSVCNNVGTPEDEEGINKGKLLCLYCILIAINLPCTVDIQEEFSDVPRHFRYLYTIQCLDKFFNATNMESYNVFRRFAIQNITTLIRNLSPSPLVVKVTVRNDESRLDDLYAQCEAAYTQDQARLARRMWAVSTIKRFIKKRKLFPAAKRVGAINIPVQECLLLCDALKTDPRFATVTDQDVNRWLLFSLTRFKKYLPHFGKYSKMILNTFYSTELRKTIDMHFILQKLEAANSDVKFYLEIALQFMLGNLDLDTLPQEEVFTPTPLQRKKYEKKKTVDDGGVHEEEEKTQKEEQEKEESEQSPDDTVELDEKESLPSEDLLIERTSWAMTSDIDLAKFSFMKVTQYLSTELNLSIESFLAWKSTTFKESKAAQRKRAKHLKSQWRLKTWQEAEDRMKKIARRKKLLKKERVVEARKLAKRGKIPIPSHLVQGASGI